MLSLRVLHPGKSLRDTEARPRLIGSLKHFLRRPSQAARGAARLSLVLDKRRRMG